MEEAIQCVETTKGSPENTRGMPQINLRVSEETKKRWQEAVEHNDEYESLTHLIELSVHHELDDEWILLSNVNAFAEGVEFDTSGITSTLDELYQEIRGMRSQMDQIEAVNEVMQREELRDVALTAYDLLPVVSDSAELANPGAPASESGHPADIQRELQDELNESVGRADVQFALDFLTYQYSNVEAAEMNGEWRYFEAERS